MREEPLPGGSLTGVVRRGDVVLRATGPWTPGVHVLLSRLRGNGFDACPLVVGVEDGREVIEHLPGQVLVYPPTGWFLEPDVPAGLGTLLRRLHDAMPGVDEVRLVPPFAPEGEPEIVCHGDFSPTNVLFVDGRATSVLDFDFAGPGPRAWDVASCLYRTAPLHAPELFAQWGLEPPPWAEVVRRGRDFLAAYGHPVHGLVDTLEVQLLRHLRLIRTGGAMFDLPRREGHDRAYAIDLAWLRAHREELRSVLEG